MTGVHSYFVDGQAVYVPDDELDEFMEACRERGSQFEEADVFSATNADGETREFTVPRSQSEGFLSDAAAGGGRADRMRTVAMGDGTRLSLGEGAVRQFVQARKNGATMSRGLLKMAGIPEAYARGRVEREEVADELARLFPDEDAVDGRGAALDNFGDALYRGGKRVAGAVSGAAQNVADAAARSPAVAAAKGAAQGFAEGLTPEGIDDFYGEGSTVGNMIHGANDFANTATKGAATTLSYALGGRSSAAGRAVRNWADSLETDTADLETGAGETANAVMKGAKDFSQNTLTTIGKYAVPGAAAVDIMGGVVDTYDDTYRRAVENGASPQKAQALASAAALTGAAEGVALAGSVGGKAGGGLLKRAAGMGGKMGAFGAARDVVEQGVEGAENPDLVRAGKAGLKSGAEGAAFDLMAAGTRALADAGRKGAQAASERRVREGIERERRGAIARERYEGRLSEEANADIEATTRQMVETGVLPTDATAPEVMRRAREKLGGRERGESHEAVEQAVMEAAQEVGERLATPERVSSPALERRQVEARMRDNERWARRSDELAAEYGREEAARRVAEERAAAERRAQGEAVQGAADAAAHEARQGDLEAAFRDYGERLDAAAARKRGGRAPAPETPEAIRDAMSGDAELQSLDAQYRKAKTPEEREAAKAKFAARVAELRQGMERQAEREGGQFLILRPSGEGQPGDLSGRPQGLTAKSIPQGGEGAQAGAKTTAKPAETKPAERRGATPEQLADLQAKIAEAEKANKTAKDDSDKRQAKFSVSVGTTSLTFNATDDGIAAAKKLMRKLGRPTDWNRQPAPERVPSAPKPTKVAKAPADAGEILKGFVETNNKHPDKGIGRTLTRNGYEYATDGVFAVRVKARPGAADGGNAETAEYLNGLFGGKAEKGTEAKATTAELETALAQAMSVKGERTRGDEKGSTDYASDMVEVWRTKDGRLAIRTRSVMNSNGDLQNVDSPRSGGSSALTASDAAFFSGETLDGAKMLGFSSGNRLAKICKAFAKRGDGEISVEVDAGGGGMLRFRGKNLEAVLMPRRGGEAEDVSGYEAASKRTGPLYALGDPRDGGGETPRTTARVRVNPNLRADVARAMNTDPAKGEVARSRTVVELSDTPDALHAIGMPKAKILTNADILRKVNRKHFISADDFAKLPEAYADPVAVFRNGEDYIVLTAKKARTADGVEKPVMVYLKPGVERNTFLASAYARESGKEAAYVNWAKKGDLLFLDKKKAALVGLKDETLSQLRPLAKGDLSPRSIAKTGADAQGGLSAQSDAAANAADGGRVDMRRLDPQRRGDPKVLEWAKKQGRTVSDGRVTPDAVREYDAQMAQGAAKAVRRWFPDMSVTYHDYGESVRRGQHAIDLRDTAGRALGWFEPGTKAVHLLPGADAATVAHEIMWHGSRDWATARAAAGDRKAQKLVEAMHEVERNAPEDLKRRVNRLYRETGADADTLLNEYGAWLTMGKGGEALEAAMAKAENRAWYAKSLNVVKETVKDYLAAHGKNRVDLSKVDGMGRDEFVKFLAGEFAGGKTLGEIGARGAVRDVSTKETAFQKARRKVYDINATLRDLQRDIEKKTGRKIAEAEDAEAANALTPGLKEAAVMNVRGKLDGYRALLRETGISDADAQYYMALKAAAGRDAKVDARNLAKLDAQAEAAVRAEWGSERIARDEAGFNAAVETRKAEFRSDYESANGSHVSPVEARRMLAELEGGEHAQGYEEIRKYLRGVMDETLDAQVKSGLLSEEMAAKYRAEEPDYIPFKNEFDAASGDFVGRGAVNLGRPEHYAAKGRKSSAGDITAHIFGDYQSTLLRGIETDVRQKLAKLVRANPELGTVEKLGEGTRLKEKQKSDRLDPANATGDPNLVLFKQGGDTYAIRLNGERGAAIAAALTERNVRRMDGWFPKFARASAALATRWSPTFSVRNFTKDNIELANIVFAEKGAVNGAKWAGRYMKSQAQMAGTLAKFVTTGKVDATTEQGRLLQKYIDAGGLIGGGATEGYDAMKKSFTPEAIARELKRGQSKSRAIANRALHSIAYLNEFAEMTTRVNAFVAELKGGATEREAALFSRRATVDFNRKGENTGVTNVVRLFSNSTLGATARATSALAKSKTGKVAAAALFANGFAQALVEYAMNHEEDERRRKSGEATGRDVPEFERKTALFCVRSGDNLYKVAQHESPFSLFNYAGNCAGRVALGQMSVKDMAKNLGVSVAELAYHFTGMGSANLTSRSGDVGDDAKTAIVSGLCPSALQPLAEMLVGTDYKGDKLYRQNFSATTPDSATAKRHTPEYAKTAAAWMNEATGGNEARKGYVDVHPEAVQKFVEGFGKNAARDVMNAYEVGKAILDGDLKRLTPRDVPVKRDFVRPLDGNTSRFFEAYDAYRADEAEFKGMSSKWTAAERREYLAAHPWLKYGKTGKRVVSVLIDGTNKERPRSGVESMGIKQLRKLTEGLVRTKSGGYAEPKRPVSDAERERAKKVMMRKQALVIEKMGR